MVFGAKGTVVPSIVRGVLGCFWFGVQAWIGGQGCQRDHHRIDPGMGKSWGLKVSFISFIIFWLMNVHIAGSGSSAVQKLEKYAAPVLTVLALSLSYGESAQRTGVSVNRFPSRRFREILRRISDIVLPGVVVYDRI